MNTHSLKGQLCACDCPRIVTICFRLKIVRKRQEFPNQKQTNLESQLKYYCSVFFFFFLDNRLIDPQTQVTRMTVSITWVSIYLKGDFTNFQCASYSSSSITFHSVFFIWEYLLFYQKSLSPPRLLSPWYEQPENIISTAKPLQMTWSVLCMSRRIFQHMEGRGNCNAIYRRSISISRAEGSNLKISEVALENILFY